MTFRAVGFDYGGVISKYSGGNFHEGVSQILGVTSNEFRQSYFKHNRLINTQDVSFRDFWTKVLTELKALDKLEPILDLWNRAIKVQIDKRLVKLARTIKRRGFAIGMLSNISPDESVRLHRRFDRLFDVVMTSADSGYIKPDPEIFQIFCKRLGIEPSQLIFIDDSEQSLSTAEAVGYSPILYQDYEDLRRRLQELEVL